MAWRKRRILRAFGGRVRGWKKQHERGATANSQARKKKIRKKEKNKITFSNPVKFALTREKEARK